MKRQVDVGPFDWVDKGLFMQKKGECIKDKVDGWLFLEIHLIKNDRPSPLSPRRTKAIAVTVTHEDPRALLASSLLEQRPKGQGNKGQNGSIPQKDG